MYECARCHAPIRDQHVIACDDRFWHENCLECALCHARPQSRDGQSMFALNDALLCREDYLRVRHTCLICKRELSSADARVALCQRFKRFVHITCLQCSICNIRLQLGDHFKMIADQSSSSGVVCAHHHSNSANPMDNTSVVTNTSALQSVSSVSATSMPPQTSSSSGGRGGGGGAKRGRKSRLNTHSLV